MEASVTVVALLLLLAATVFWVWALVDVVRRPGGATAAAANCSGSWS